MSICLFSLLLLRGSALGSERKESHAGRGGRFIPKGGQLRGSAVIGRFDLKKNILLIVGAAGSQTRAFSHTQNSLNNSGYSPQTWSAPRPLVQQQLSSALHGGLRAGEAAAHTGNPHRADGRAKRRRTAGRPQAPPRPGGGGGSNYYGASFRR